MRSTGRVYGRLRGVPSFSMNTSKQCPFCAEFIKPDAIKCRHCHEMLSPSESGRKGVAKPKSFFKVIALFGLALFGLIFVLATTGLLAPGDSGSGRYPWQQRCHDGCAAALGPKR